ncbi:MAG: hypothetical protein IT427_01995 [Pirellulales bacterium]|nr:hypothetical protein [Pirellulales bacterium]
MNYLARIERLEFSALGRRSPIENVRDATDEELAQLIGIPLSELSDEILESIAEGPKRLTSH